MSHVRRLEHPDWMTRRPWKTTLRLAPGDVRATPSQLSAFRSFARAGDPPADAVVTMMTRLPGGAGRRLFEQALEEGIDALADPPRELVEFFATVDAVPYWVDQDLLDRGARVMGRTGLPGWRW